MSLMMRLADELTSLLQDTQTIVLMVVVACLVYKLMGRKSYKLPPMPHSLPIVGNMLNLRTDEALSTFTDRWAKEINESVIRLRFGLVDAIILNDYRSIKEALIDRADDFAGRPYNTVFEIIGGEFQDVAFTDATPEWRKKRKILMAALRTFSVGEVFEKRVTICWDRIAELLDKEVGTPFDPMSHAKLLVYNYMAAVCYKQSFALDDPDFLEIKNGFMEGSKYFGRNLSVDNFKFLKYLPFDMPDVKYCKKAMSIIRNYSQRQVEEHKKNFDKDNVRDFTDHLLKAKQEAEEEDKETVLTDTHLSLIVNDVFAAGMATQQIIVSWYFNIMAKYPHIQQKAYEEINSVLGSNRPTCKDRVRLPYSDACVYELIRFGTMTSVGVPRKTMVDTQVCGYDVPADTLIFANHSSIHFSPEFFPEPHQFKPERFIHDGAVFKPKEFMPFGSGTRVCAGEIAARYTLFLLFVHLVQDYKISAPEGKEITLDHDITLGLPLPFEIILDKRVSAEE